MPSISRRVIHEICASVSEGKTPDEICDTILGPPKTGSRGLKPIIFTSEELQRIEGFYKASVPYAVVIEALSTEDRKITRFAIRQEYIRLRTQGVPTTKSEEA